MSFLVCSIVSFVSPGEPIIKSPCTSNPAFLASFANCFICSTVKPFFMFFSIISLPDSYPTINKRQLDRFISFIVTGSSVSALALHAHVIFKPLFLYSLQNSRTRDLFIVNVSSSKKTSFTSRLSLIHSSSSRTFDMLLTLYFLPMSV